MGISWSRLRERIDLYESLMRLDRPIGILLLLWPTLWGLWLSARGGPYWIVAWIYVLGTVLMRSAGCVINDLADRNFDPHVERTRNRPLASGQVSAKEALLLFAGLVLCAFALVLLFESWLLIGLSVAALFLAASYPFTNARCAAGRVAVGAAPGVAPSRYPRGSMVVRPPSLVLRVVALLERGLPPGLLADNETRRRSLLIVGTIWVLVIACVFTIPVLLGTTRGGARIAASVVNLGTISVALGALGLLRRRGPPAAGHTVTAIAFIGIMWVVAISGGLTSPYWVLLVAVPILAAQMAGRAAGHLWTLLCLAAVTLLWVLDRLGVELPRLTDPAAHTTTAALYTGMAVLAGTC